MRGLGKLANKFTLHERTLQKQQPVEPRLIVSTSIAEHVRFSSTDNQCTDHSSKSYTCSINTNLNGWDYFLFESVWCIDNGIWRNAVVGTKLSACTKPETNCTESAVAVVFVHVAFIS